MASCAGDSSIGRHTGIEEKVPAQFHSRRRVWVVSRPDHWRQSKRRLGRQDRADNLRPQVSQRDKQSDSHNIRTLEHDSMLARGRALGRFSRANIGPLETRKILRLPLAIRAVAGDAAASIDLLAGIQLKFARSRTWVLASESGSKDRQHCAERHGCNGNAGRLRRSVVPSRVNSSRILHR